MGPMTNLAAGKVKEEWRDLKWITDYIRDRHSINLYSLNTPLYFMSCLTGEEGGVENEILDSRTGCILSPVTYYPQ